MTRRVRKHRRGFTLVEVLISVAILAGLMVATATALQASIDAFEGNQSSADTLGRGRMTVMQMGAQLRAGHDHLPATSGKQTTFITGTTVTDNGIWFRADSNETIVYWFDSSTKKLTVTVNGGTARTVASHVQSFSVKMTPTRSAQSIKTGGYYDEVERMTLTLTLLPFVDGEEKTAQPLTLTETITPRARLWN